MDETSDPLLDLTSDDPRQHLDFDPETGNIVPRFDNESASQQPALGE
ncbi:hypothetical protein [Allochromatium tepidum]|nr:hypothetical protein [Allochromatium tepidum]